MIPKSILNWFWRCRHHRDFEAYKITELWRKNLSMPTLLRSPQCMVTIKKHNHVSRYSIPLKLDFASNRTHGSCLPQRNTWTNYLFSYCTSSNVIIIIHLIMEMQCSLCKVVYKMSASQRHVQGVPTCALGVSSRFMLSVDNYSNHNKSCEIQK